MSLCLLAAAFILAKQGAVLVQSEKAAREKICIVVDAGHGGSDPGAQSSFDGTKYIEKNINLAVAKKVRDILTANGVNVQILGFVKSCGN